MSLSHKFFQLFYVHVSILSTSSVLSLLYVFYKYVGSFYWDFRGSLKLTWILILYVRYVLTFRGRWNHLSFGCCLIFKSFMLFLFHSKTNVLYAYMWLLLPYALDMPNVLFVVDGFLYETYPRLHMNSYDYIFYMK